MRGEDRQTSQLFSYLSPDTLVPATHPLRPIRQHVNKALDALSPAFGLLYADGGRPSIAPEKLLRSLLLQAFFSIRSERQLMEQLTYNMMFRWFVGLSMDVTVWDVTVFTKNRDRLLAGEIARGFLLAVINAPEVKPLLSGEHFSVDGTLIEAWASMKSFRPRDGSGEPPGPGRNGERNFHGERRRNDTHASNTDPDARLFRKSSGASSSLCHMGHVLMDNRQGLVVDALVTHATGTAERDAAIIMLNDLTGSHHRTLGADKAYDTQDFVRRCRERGVTPHVARNDRGRRSAIDARTTRHTGYDLSLRARKRIEEVFGWVKASAGLRKTRHRGTARVDWMFTLTVAAYDLVRIPKFLTV